LVLAVLLAAAACYVTVGGCRGGSEKPAEGDSAKGVSAKGVSAKGVSQETLIALEAYYPLNPGHQFIVDFLQEVEAAHPGQVTLEVIDIQASENWERWKQTGLGCAGVFVNGKSTHEVTRDGETRTVNFIKRMGTLWTREDFEAVIDELLGVDQEDADVEQTEEAEPTD
jgi:hypothetical protein